MAFASENTEIHRSFLRELVAVHAQRSPGNRRCGLGRCWCRWPIGPAVGSPAPISVVGWFTAKWLSNSWSCRYRGTTSNTPSIPRRDGWPPPTTWDARWRWAAGRRRSQLRVDLIVPAGSHRFTAHLRLLVKQGHGHQQISASYLWATRSADWWFWRPGGLSPLPPRGRNTAESNMECYQ